MTDSEEVLPEIRFKPVIRRYHAIRDLLALQEPGERITSEFLNELRKLLCGEAQSAVTELYLLEGGAVAPLGELLSSFYGVQPTAMMLDSLAWRLAACYDTFNAGEKAESQFVLVEKPDWLALSIVSSCYINLSRAMKPLLDVQFRVLSGPMGGLAFRQMIPHSWFISKMGRELGGGTRERRYPDHRELSGFWLVGKLDTWDPAHPRVSDFRATSSVLEHNRDLRKIRNQPCPLGFTHACYECWVGLLDKLSSRYRVAKCSAFRREVNKSFALFERPTHLRHYTLRKCVHCKKDEAPFEPSHPSRFCLNCQTEFIRAYRRF